MIGLPHGNMAAKQDTRANGDVWHGIGQARDLCFLVHLLVPDCEDHSVFFAAALSKRAVIAAGKRGKHRNLQIILCIRYAYGHLL
jgi:hypothetical protein